nr:hypothetical protein [Mycobacterium sp. E3298]
MKSAYKDRYGRDICAEHKLRPFHDGEYGRLAIVKKNEGGFYVEIPDYKAWDEDLLKLENYLEGESGFWEFEIVDE